MRWVRRLSREKFSMLFTLVQPMLFWLIFFGSLFQRAANIQILDAPNYMSFLAGGVVVMTVLNNGLAGGVDLLFDKENGFLERMMSTPIHRSSVILSRYLFVMAITGMQILVILSIAFVFGVRLETGLPGIALILAIGMLFGVGTDRHFDGYCVFRQKPRRFLFLAGLSFPAHDFSQLGARAPFSHAGMDAGGGPGESDDLGHRCRPPAHYHGMGRGHPPSGPGLCNPGNLRCRLPVRPGPRPSGGQSGRVA